MPQVLEKLYIDLSNNRTQNTICWKINGPTKLNRCDISNNTSNKIEILVEEIMLINNFNFVIKSISISIHNQNELDFVLNNYINMENAKIYVYDETIETLNFEKLNYLKELELHTNRKNLININLPLSVKKLIYNCDCLNAKINDKNGINDLYIIQGGYNKIPVEKINDFLNNDSFKINLEKCVIKISDGHAQDQDDAIIDLKNFKCAKNFAISTFHGQNKILGKIDGAIMDINKTNTQQKK